MDLKGRYITYVCRIEDPEKWREANPMMTHRFDGVAVVGMSAGDLMAYSDALEDLVPTDAQEKQHEAYARHCHPGTPELRKL